MRAGSVLIFLSTLVFSFVNAQRNIVASQTECEKFPNEEFDIDLGRCQNTCKYYGRTWGCPLSYKPDGDCFCKPGFARLKEDGKCVSVTKNAACKAQLPITPESCIGPLEMYTDTIVMGQCDKNCLTYGCQVENQDSPKEYRWGPHCICGENDQRYLTYSDGNNRRLSNGTCVHVYEEKCVAEFQPSPARCAALGQIYTENAPCQQSCYDEEYCPPPGPTCICPSNKFAMPHDATYYTFEKRFYGQDNAYEYYHQTGHPTTVITCYSKTTCPKSTMQARP